MSDAIEDITTVSDLIAHIERYGEERLGGYHVYDEPGTTPWRVATMTIPTVHGPATVTIAAHVFYTNITGGRSASVEVGIDMPGLAARPDWHLIELGPRGPEFSNMAAGADSRGHGPIYPTPTAPVAPIWDQFAALLNAIEFV